MIECMTSESVVENKRNIEKNGQNSKKKSGKEVERVKNALHHNRWSAAL